MSRCFPFPPPGYERKHRPEDLDVVKEAKRREKRHTKDRKNKERSKDKEKKERDGIDEKHRDKKDRKGKHKDKKEKHRDKKNDKEDQGKDKEKSSISEESTVAVKFEEKSGENLHPKGYSKDRSSVVDEGKCSVLLQGQNGGKPFQTSYPSQGIQESKFVQELDRRIREDETNRGSQLPETVAGLDKRDQETAASAAVRNSSGVLAAEEKSYSKDKRVDSRKLDAQVPGNEVGGNAMVQKLSKMEKGNLDGISRPVEEHNDRRWEGKEKYKETGDEKRGDKRKDRDKKSHGKDREKEKEKKKEEKEKKKEEKAKVKTESKTSDRDNSKNVGSNNYVGVASDKGTDLLKDVKNSAVNDENIKKRKDMATNGFLHESEIRPGKMQRPASHNSTENGKKLEARQTPSKSTSDKHAVPNSVQLDKSNSLMNGIIEAQQLSPPKHNSSSTPVVSDRIAEASKISLCNSSYLDNTIHMPKIKDQVAEASRRPPHPDSKYLGVVLTVPKLVDLSENDDQEWLFNKKGPSNRPKFESVVVEEELCVWSEAVHIESADVYALPYVIPF